MLNGNPNIWTPFNNNLGFSLSGSGSPVIIVKGPPVPQSLYSIVDGPIVAVLPALSLAIIFIWFGYAIFASRLTCWGSTLILVLVSRVIGMENVPSSSVFFKAMLLSFKIISTVAFSETFPLMVILLEKLGFNSSSFVSNTGSFVSGVTCAL